MANQRSITPSPIITSAASIPRGPSSESLDGERSNSNIERAISPAPLEAESSPSDGRINGGSGDREAETKGTPFDRGLPEPSAPNNPFTTADNVLKVIAQRWDEARELG